MIEINKYASGSTGNLYKVSDGETTIMIECGIRFSAIREAFDFMLSKVAGCLVSHSHGDHCKAVKGLVNAGVDIYLSAKTQEEIKQSGHRIHNFKEKESFRVGTFTVLPFPLQHDVENHGFLILSDSGGKLLYITDTYYCKFRFKGITHFMVECNYVEAVLESNIKSGVTHPAQANRVKRSHFGLSNVIEFFRENDLSVCQEIHLIHISSTNGDSGKMKTAIQELSGIPVYA